ncbi:hypothetical protein BYT27DRAFT_7316373, partial [Phlegmacium glaucopus]
EKSTLYLLKKEVYSEQTQNLVRILVQAGVSAKNIMGVIKAVLGIAGITTVGNISPHTVAQIIREGYIAACIQLGFELDKTEAVTFGSDGTGHKNLNYNSHYAHYKVWDADGEKAQVTHFLGLQRSLDGSSEQAMRDWDDQLQKIFDIYNDSPLAKEQSSFTRLINVYSKLAGMHADHCAKEKKDYDLMGKKKTEAVHQVLGKRRIIDDTNEELMPFFLSGHKEMVEKAGGEDDWNNLDESAQKEYKAAMLEKLTTDLGQVALIFKDEIDKLKGEKLKDHFQAFKKAGAPNLGTINSKSKVAEKREAIKAAIRSYNKGEWKLSPKYVDPGIQNEDEGEVFDGYNDFHSSDENSGWEDE